VRTFRAGEIILQLEVVLVILYGLRVAASVGERLLDGVGRQTGNRILTVANAPVLQANVVDQILLRIRLSEIWTVLSWELLLIADEAG